MRGQTEWKREVPDAVGTRAAPPSSPGPPFARALAMTEQVTQTGSWNWPLTGNVIAWSDELYRIFGLEPQSVAITPEFLLSRVHPEDRDVARRSIAEALKRGGSFRWQKRVIRPDGSVRELETLGAVHGRDPPISLYGTCRDVTEQIRERRLQRAEHRVLERVARGLPLVPTLEMLVVAVEECAPPALGSVLLVDDDGLRVLPVAAPNLPSSYRQELKGRLIGPKSGSCGTAAFLRRPVLVEDIATDPLWEDFRDIALAHGLRACWSMPIMATDERVLGTFAFYYRTPRKPAKSSLALVTRASRLAGIAIERHQTEAQLRSLSAHVQAVLEEERTAIAREIHDDLGQSLTVLKMDMAWVRRRLQSAAHGAHGGPPSPANDDLAKQGVIVEKLQEMSDFTDQVIQRVRKISSDLRPGVLDDLGLLAAIEWQAIDFQRRTRTTCRVQSRGAERAFERDVSTAAFRILQEALTNVARHAKAQTVKISVEAEAAELVLEVEDDGVGISPEKIRNPTSLGLLGMRERAHRLGGSVSIGSGDSKGIRLCLRLPLRHATGVLPQPPAAELRTASVGAAAQVSAEARR